MTIERKSSRTCLTVGNDGDVSERLARVKLLLLALSFTMLATAGVAAQERPLRRFELRAESPAFWKLIARREMLQRVATGFGFTEGPAWDPRGFLYVSDETLNQIFRVYPDGHRESLMQLGDPDGNTFDRDFNLLDCASVLRAIIRLDSRGQSRVLADRFEGKKFNSPNDIVLGPDDAVYFTDPTLDLPKGEKQALPFQGVYRLDAGGEVRLLTRDLAQPNGLAFSPDGKRFYVDDSERRDIRVYDFLPAGTLANGRQFGSEPGGPDDGVPDGIRVDRSGNLYVTGPLGIWVWDPAGHHLGTIVVPEQPANMAWGDPDYRTLYITATTSVYRLRTRVRGFVPYLSRHRRSGSTKLGNHNHPAG
jgi:gluconolactonase